jgi:hypothetical protein
MAENGSYQEKSNVLEYSHHFQIETNAPLHSFHFIFQQRVCSNYFFENLILRIFSSHHLIYFF